MTKKPLILIIRDGWGFNPDSEYNAIHLAKTPNHDRYLKEYPTSLIAPSGESVGLPPANQGSSEVGHLNMGAGRVVYQSLVRISKSVSDGDFFKNDTLVKAMQRVKASGKTLHLMGLVQDQGVHAHSDHLVALLKMASEQGMDKTAVVVHVLADGRDTAPKSVKRYLQPIEAAMHEYGVGVFGSIVGRYYGMDRDNRWDRVKKAYDLLVDSEAVGSFNDIFEAIDDAYANDETDEFILPRITDKFKPISAGDGMIFFNYRLDRTRELTKAFVLDGFDGFETKVIDDLNWVCFTEYYDGVANTTRAEVGVVYGPIDLQNLYGKYVADKGLKQLRIAETEKYAHVTFFFNGQSDVIFENEDRIVVPSPDVPTYDLKPEMSAYEVRDKVLDVIKADKYDTIILNFANPDMVGHTGNLKATIEACEVVDSCVGSVVDAILAKDGVVLLTADHGNAEQMIDYTTREPMTAHTNNLVWVSLISNREDLQLGKVKLKPTGGKLADLIPTMFDIMGLEIPAEMTGDLLIEKV